MYPGHSIKKYKFILENFNLIVLMLYVWLLIKQKQNPVILLNSSHTNSL